MCQTIKGFVTDLDGNPLTGSVVLKKIKQPEIILQFSSIDDKGEYMILLQTPLDSIIIEAKVYSYDLQQKELYNLQNRENTIIENFKLFPKTNVLKEVVIEEKPIRIKGDTTIYNPNSFKDGSERVIEDLLRKLPGIEIKDNGIIKFKGKNIKKMLLDGDDLFSGQYTIGSRNIDVDMLDKVEAIENFSENFLLKGLENSDDVALNLKFKKGKTDLSGTANLGVGYKEKYSFSATEILLNSKTKNFGVISSNNIGTNNTPYDFYSSVLSVDEMNENKFIAKEIISQGNFSSTLDDKFHRNNKNFYTSLNSLYKFTDKVTAKINLNLYTDLLSRNSSLQSSFSSADENFIYSQKESMSKSPKLYNANLQVLNNVSKSLNWEYLGKFDYQNINYKSTTSNNDLIQSNNVETKKWLSKQNFNITKRINDKYGIIGSFTYTNSNAPQIYMLTPGTSISEDLSAKQNYQNSTFSKSTFSNNITFLGKFNGFKWSLKTGYYNEQNKYNSKLQILNENDDIDENADFRNDLIFNYDVSYLNGNVNYNVNKFGFRLGVTSQYFLIKTNDAVRNKLFNEKKLALSPVLNLFYKITKQSTLTSGYSFNQIAPEETNLFEGIVQTSFSGFSNNEANIEFLKTHNFNINYNYTDTFNQTFIRLGLDYNQRENNYFNKSLITPNYIVSSSFLLNSGNKDYRANFSGEKYVYFLRTNFKLSTSYSVSLDKNIVNDSELRDIKSKFLMVDFSAKVSIAKKVFFENSFSFNNNIYTLDNINQNDFSSIKDSFKTIFKIKKQFNSVTTLNFIVPDLSQQKKYLFLDSELTFTSKNKKVDYSIIGRNLTNNKFFETVNVSDYSRSVSSYNLIDRFVLASIAFKF